MKEKVRLSPEDKTQVAEMYASGKYTADEIKRTFDISKSTFYRITKGIVPEVASTLDDWIESEAAQTELDLCEPDEELVRENTKLAKQTQKTRDLSRMKDKSYREYARLENAVAALNDEFMKVYKANNLSHLTKYHMPAATEGSFGIVHFSDVHFNEQIDIPGNEYNFTVASQRIRKHIQKALRYFKAEGVTHVLVAMTGDMFNSDRRMDEVLSNATNRSQALFLGFDIMKEAILELNQQFNVTVACVSGNEGRVDKDVHWGTAGVNNNYDVSLHELLARHFVDSKGVSFILQENYSECLVNVGGRNILMVHGHNGSAATAAIETQVAKYRSKYAEQKQFVDFVIMGHIHSAYISDFHARSSGLPGGNDYSDKRLNLPSRASQNLYVVDPTTGGIDGLKVDLQDASAIEPYPFNTLLEAYNSKSSSKGKAGTVIHQVVV